MRLRLLLLLSFAFAVVAPAGESEGARRRVAVLGFKNLRPDAATDWVGAATAETLATKLTAVRALLVVDRQQVDKLLKEQQFQASDLGDATRSAEMGRLLGAQSLVVGSFVSAGGKVQFNVRVVDVATGEVLSAASLTGAESEIMELPLRLGDAVIESLQRKVVVVQGEKKVEERASAPVVSSDERKAMAAAPAVDAEAYRAFGEATDLLQKARYADALARVEVALRRDPAYADALLLKGTLLQHLGRPREALPLCRTAEAALRKAGREDKVAEALDRIGENHETLGEYDAAAEAYRKAVAIHERRGDRLGAIGTRISMADVETKRGRADEAEKGYAAALAAVRELGNDFAVARILTNLGLLRDRTGRKDEALAAYEEARGIAVRIGNRVMLATILNNIGSIHSERNEFEPARKTIEEALAIATELGIEGEVASANGNLGVLLFRQGRFAEAEPALKKAGDAFRRIGNRAHLATMEENLGQTSKSLGRPADAGPHFAEALRLRRELRDEAAVASNQYQLADLAYNAGRFDEVLALAGEAVPVLRRTGQQPVLMGLLLYRAGVLADERKDYAAAVVDAREALGIAETLRGQIPGLDVDAIREVVREIEKAGR